MARCLVCIQVVLEWAQCSALFIPSCSLEAKIMQWMSSCVSCMCPGLCSETRLWCKGPSRCCRRRLEHSSPQTRSCRTSSAWWAPLLGALHMPATLSCKPHAYMCVCIYWCIADISPLTPLWVWTAGPQCSGSTVHYIGSVVHGLFVDVGQQHSSQDTCLFCFGRETVSVCLSCLCALLCQPSLECTGWGVCM